MTIATEKNQVGIDCQNCLVKNLANKTKWDKTWKRKKKTYSMLTFYDDHYVVFNGLVLRSLS